MKGRKDRVARWAALGLLVVALSVVAAGCGGGDDGGGGDTAIEGLGTSTEEIATLARDEGEVNLVIWPNYAVLTDEFTAATGCKVNTKDGASSDDMISLMQTGAYDGGSFSGNATVRMMATGDVAPVDTDLIPNYADISEGIKGKDYNSLDGQPYGVPHGRGPNYLMFRTDEVPEDTDSWAVIWEDDQLAKYKGKISIYDDSIFIADAAIYLKATQPELGIEDPYQLTQEQFDAAVALLKKQAPNVGEYWPGDVVKQIGSYTNGDSVVGTTWPYQYLQLLKAKVPVKAIKPKEGTTGWSDTWMIYSKAKNPNCMYMWMNYMASPVANATATVWFGEAPTSPQACAEAEKQSPGHCETFHATDEGYFKDVWYWTTPTKECLDGRGPICTEFSEWTKAWTEIKG